MRWLRRGSLFLKTLWDRKQTETELLDEMQYHFDQEVEANLQAGMNAEAARKAAQRAIGSVALYKDECRDARNVAFLENGFRNVRYALRVLRKTPVFTTVAIITLALGIGANTTIFTLVNTLLFHPLPVKDPQRLVFFNEGEGVNMSYPNFRDFRGRNDVLSGITAYRFMPVGLSIDTGKNGRVWTYEATGNYFDLLGVQPLLGRFFHREVDDKPGTQPVTVLSYRCWQQRFNADRAVVGKNVKINGLPYAVIGVAPAAFTGTELIISPDMWVPMSMEARIEPGYNSWLGDRATTQIWVLGRLKPGVSTRRAESSLNVIAARLAHDYPNENQGLHIQLSPPGLIGKALRGPVLGFSGVLMGLAGLVLSLACINLAGMLFARASDRRKEVAIRLSIGAAKGQLLTQLLTESFLLACAGAALGFLICLSLCRLVARLNLPFDIPVNTSLHPDVRVLLFTMGAAFVTTVLCGLLPALQALRTDLLPALKNEAVIERFRRWTIRDALVVTQTALSVVLVISSFLVVRSLDRALSLHLGFNPDRAVSVSFDLASQNYDETRGRVFQQRLLDQIATLPSVEAVGSSNNVPLRLGVNGSNVSIIGKQRSFRSHREFAYVYDISPGYLAAAGTRLLSGRDVDAHDGLNAPLVAVVNETFAQKLLPGQDPIGKYLRFGKDDSGAPIQIIGVVEAGKYQSLGEDPTSAVFRPVAQHHDPWTTIVVRTSLPPAQAIARIRGAITSMDPELPLFNVGSLRDQLAMPLFPARAAAIALGVFGLIAIVLAATGIFAVMAYSVSRRAREIGIRMALGARLTQVLQFVLTRTVALCAIGLVIGTTLTLMAGPALSAVLYGVSAYDPVAYILAVSVMASVSLLACWHPALRAIRIDPARALRDE